MFEKFTINEKLSDFDLIFHSVSKNEIISKDMETLNSVLAQLRANKEKSRRKLMITFDGYDNDKREVYEIDEIRKYVAKVFDENYDLFYYLTLLDNNASIILACIGNITNIKYDNYNRIKLIIDTPDNIRMKIVNGILTACKFNVEVAKEILKKLFNYDKEVENGKFYNSQIL